jgi:hypothetical protein
VAGLRAPPIVAKLYLRTVSESGSSFFHINASIAYTPARARNVIESGPQAALFVLLRPSAEPVYRDPRAREWGRECAPFTLIERKQFRLTRAVVRSDRIDDFCDAKVSRMARTSRDHRNEVTRVPIARSLRALVFLRSSVRLVSPFFLFSLSLPRPLTRSISRSIFRARGTISSRDVAP